MVLIGWQSSKVWGYLQWYTETGLQSSISLSCGKCKENVFKRIINAIFSPG